MEQANETETAAGAAKWRGAARQGKAQRRGDAGLPRGVKADYERLLTDKDVASLMRVSVSTVRRLATKGPQLANGLDLRLAEPIYVGEMRRWPRSRVYALLGIGEAGKAAEAAR